MHFENSPLENLLADTTGFHSVMCSADDYTLAGSTKDNSPLLPNGREVPSVLCIIPCWRQMTFRKKMDRSEEI
jgi:hypothetical protein